MITRTETPESSNINWFEYDSDLEDLIVAFRLKSGGESKYEYAAVPAEVHERFKDAPSKGQFFASSIKGHYTTRKVS